MLVPVLLFGFMLWNTIQVTYCVQKYYMEDDCGKIIDMSYEDITAGRLLVTRRSKYRNKLSCYVTIVAPGNKRLIVVFRKLEIEFESTCDDDYVTLLDGYSRNFPVVTGFPERMCGTSTPRDSYVTSGSNLTVFFKSDIHKTDDGFEIVFTAFHKAAACQADELRCENGRCIDDSLFCNGFNHCGDGSDECEVSNEAMYAIVISVFLLTLVAIGLATIYRKRQKQNRSKINQKQLVFRQCGTINNTTSSGPCLTCQLTSTNPSWTQAIFYEPELDDTEPSVGKREPEVFCITDRTNSKRASI